jgi:hypothetical protein
MKFYILTEINRFTKHTGVFPVKMIEASAHCYIMEILDVATMLKISWIWTVHQPFGILLYLLRLLSVTVQAPGSWWQQRKGPLHGLFLGSSSNVHC